MTGIVSIGQYVAVGEHVYRNGQLTNASAATVYDLARLACPAFTSYEVFGA